MGDPGFSVAFVIVVVHRLVDPLPGRVSQANAVAITEDNKPVCSSAILNYLDRESPINFMNKMANMDKKILKFINF